MNFEKVNLSIAIFLFTDKKITLARAAELADKSIREFIDILTSHDITGKRTKDGQKKGGKTGKNLGVIEILTKRFGKLAEGYNDKIMEFHNNILDLMITNVLDYKKLAETTFIC